MKGLSKHGFHSLQASTFNPIDLAETLLPADCTAIHKSFHRKNKKNLSKCPLRLRTGTGEHVPHCTLTLLCAGLHGSKVFYPVCVKAVEDPKEASVSYTGISSGRGLSSPLWGASRAILCHQSWKLGLDQMSRRGIPSLGSTQEPQEPMLLRTCPMYLLLQASVFFSWGGVRDCGNGQLLQLSSAKC